MLIVNVNEHIDIKASHLVILRSKLCVVTMYTVLPHLCYAPACFLQDVNQVTSHLLVRTKSNIFAAPLIPRGIALYAFATQIELDIE